jgi:riboflavin synthase
MFTGIIETVGTVQKVEQAGTNRSFWIASAITNELKVDQSLSHNGACLTVEVIDNGLYKVTAVAETLLKTNLGQWQPGTRINLERCLSIGGRLDGHFVQGHVDGTGICTAKSDQNGSWLFTFSYPAEHAALLVEKGSVSINGTSLTLFHLNNNSFEVAIIPYTYEHTNFSDLLPGDTVNLEFDLIGKYIRRKIMLG